MESLTQLLKTRRIEIFALIRVIRGPNLNQFKQGAECG
jgi:hypothetical protein